VEEERAVFAAAVERPGRGRVIVRAQGELDLMSVPELEAALEEAGEEGVAIELDLAELEFIDSTGVHLILRTSARSRRHGRDFAITAASPEVRRAFELVGLLDRLPFRDPGQSSS
jgi:anti-sigma B factor antagonist